MKIFFLIISLSFIGIGLFAQADINSATTEDHNKTDVQIEEVKKENTLAAIKSKYDKREIGLMAANGNYTNFVGHPSPDSSMISQIQQGQYKGLDYSYYEKIYLKSKKLALAGRIITIAGAGAIVMSIPIALLEYAEADYLTFTAIFFVGGGVLLNVGFPILIVGTVRMRNNKKAMEKIKQGNRLSFGINSHGIGFAYSF